MKQINALVHHIRSAAVVDALRDAGVTNITLLDVKGTLKPLSEAEQEYSVKAGLVVISEVRISIVCADDEVSLISEIIRRAGRIGSSISGWIYVSPVELALPIGGPDTEVPT